ncbi:acidic leucine-rich nuclear phosphoprotein 32 family member B-like [Rhopalosiphum maidis]|uniref:acidic leucine-rich nuclear phosphoprotein 32 family member B-like n=1 Tax=Rhopalosiphum maidis TaxID=43146 RepID=UPI000EFEA889|nr:acidic leucine-rich nuclear phosphoprotein 32 family member B-like [Rhopalosiphum maidis]
MKLKTNNSAKKPVNTNKNKSPKKQAKGGVQVRKEKSKDVVKPTILKKEGEKVKVVTPPNPEKLALQELWAKAILNVSNMTNLSEEESSVAKLLVDYKNKSSVPQKRTKLKNMITKGFSKFKDTSDEVLDGIYEKLINEFKAIGGNVDSINKDKSKKPESKTPKSKKEEVSNDEEMDDDEDEVDDDEDDEVDDDDEIEGLEIDDDDDDDDEESEEEKPKPKGKGAFKNGKSQPNKNKNGSKFKGGKVQKNKKFGKKK